LEKYQICEISVLVEQVTVLTVLMKKMTILQKKMFLLYFLTKFTTFIEQIFSKISKWRMNESKIQYDRFFAKKKTKMVLCQNGGII
jgi:hypothetical protein